MTRCFKKVTRLDYLPILLVSSRPSLPVYQSLFRPRKLDSGPFTRLGTTMAENYRIEYNWIKGVETLEGYQPGGPSHHDW
ncbi:kinase-like domain-containing protein [Penicillium canescens]|uniref:Kinase-like domain-containing protein n=1 Tax=Penicillium canescens TaxID=5083 RepID=A0AAD6IBT9_PENCN|nr:kinase-like domain-containing protein [Penicillium canescens]KAJ6019881.1 kinase-like domain-containing protein [Penicillium canescens]KAJ6039195.1 kinase-like domain-containing protein [Penicillium canescens]KAJ6047030.1 kinase-like domain-containing protein [Penicillium canescens]KAJ6060878.1 kinase-like domain-containing protein [Penicillium canescens]KAJ6093656.1 kinase-like domain-containing protein [Penicillium canescens]